MKAEGLIPSCLLALVGACAGLEVSQIDPVERNPVKGISYSLPFATYRISVVRTVTDCDIDANGGMVLKFDVSAAAQQFLARDPAHSYVIDSESLSNWFKTSELSWELHDNGMLKSIGGKAQDKTSEFITSVVGTAFKVAQTAAIAAIGADPKAQVCGPMLTRLKQRDALERIVANVTRDVEAAKARYKAMSDVLGTIGSDGMKAHQNQLYALAMRIVDRQIASEQAQAQLTELIKKLTITHTFMWPPDGSDLKGEESMSPAALKKLGGDPNSATSLDLGVKLRILPRGESDKVVSGPGEKFLDAKVAGPIAGIRYRPPMEGYIEISLCSVAGSKLERRPCAAPQTLKVADGPIPQLGRVHVIPFTNGIFQDNALELNFAATGALESGKYNENAARALVAAQTAGKVVDAVQQGIKDLALAGPSAELALLQKQKEVLTARKELNNAKDALRPKGTEEDAEQAAIVQSNTTLLNARKANLEAQLALEEARSKAAAAAAPKPK